MRFVSAKGRQKRHDERRRRTDDGGDARRQLLLCHHDEAVAAEKKEHAGGDRDEPRAPSRPRLAAHLRVAENHEAGDDEARARQPKGRHLGNGDAHREVGRSPEKPDRSDGEDETAIEARKKSARSA